MTLNGRLGLSCIWMQRRSLFFIFVKTVRLRSNVLHHFCRSWVHWLLSFIVTKNYMLSWPLLLLQLNWGLQCIAIVFFYTPNSFSNSKNRLWQVFLKSANRSNPLFTVRCSFLHLTTISIQTILAQTNNRLKLLFPRDLNASRTWNLCVPLYCNGFIHVLLVQTDSMRGHL